MTTVQSPNRAEDFWVLKFTLLCPIPGTILCILQYLHIAQVCTILIPWGREQTWGAVNGSFSACRPVCQPPLLAPLTATLKHEKRERPQEILDTNTLACMLRCRPWTRVWSYGRAHNQTTYWKPAWIQEMLCFVLALILTNIPGDRQRHPINTFVRL